MSRSKPDFRSVAHALINGAGPQRTRAQLVQAVRDSLVSMFDKGVTHGHAEAKNGPKIGALHALESLREKIDTSIAELRKEVGL